MSSLRVRQILTEVMTGSGEAERLPERLCRACTEAVPVSGAGLALMTGAGHRATITAFAVLRAYARRNGRQLSAVAAAVIDGSLDVAMSQSLGHSE